MRWSYYVMITSAILLGLTIGCSKVMNSASSNHEVEKSVIGHLECVDKTITIKKGHQGPLYSVKTIDGEDLATDVGAVDLFAEFPELEQLFKKGYAWQDASYFPSTENRAKLDYGRFR